MRESRHRHLTRSAADRILGGVLGGFGQYFHISANLLRIIYVILTIMTAIVPGVIIYLILLIIMPPDPANPGILGMLHTLGDLSKQVTRDDHSRSRRQLTDVEEKDIKRNERS
ncbi:PspC domain-containing protein [Limosilactobacillus pontis]|uniref:PspC domain-containing protein n=1 Tax=Limosilactobacillus pontis TaxID=35787 RepID=UPI00241E27B8|nr:PspC domain-containing protein [Limosilactobacillus pontis]